MLAVEILKDHRENYDRDCGFYDGCSCGWTTSLPFSEWPDDDDYSSLDPEYPARDAFAEHLASVLVNPSNQVFVIRGETGPELGKALRKFKMAESALKNAGLL